MTVATDRTVISPTFPELNLTLTQVLAVGDSIILLFEVRLGSNDRCHFRYGERSGRGLVFRDDDLGKI